MVGMKYVNLQNDRPASFVQDLNGVIFLDTRNE